MPAQPHDSLPLDAVRLGPRGGLLEDAHDLAPRALGEVTEVALLPVTVLVRGGDSAVDSGSRLSQLKSSETAVLKAVPARVCGALRLYDTD